MSSALITYNEARARADQMRDGAAKPANDDLWSGASRSRYQIRRRMKRSLRRTTLRFWRSLLTIIRSPIAIQRWIVVLFIIATLSTLIIDGISLSTGFSSLLQRDIIVP